MCDKRCEGLFRHNRERSTCMCAETAWIRNNITTKVYIWISFCVGSSANRKDSSLFRLQKIQITQNYVSTSPLCDNICTTKYLTTMNVPDVRRKMEIYVQSIKNMYMIVVPPGEVKVSPIPSAKSSSIVPHTWLTWGADILLRSKVAATMNTGPLVKCTDKL